MASVDPNTAIPATTTPSAASGTDTPAALPPLTQQMYQPSTQPPSQPLFSPNGGDQQQQPPPQPQTQTQPMSQPTQSSIPQYPPILDTRVLGSAPTEAAALIEDGTTVGNTNTTDVAPTQNNAATADIVGSVTAAVLSAVEGIKTSRSRSRSRSRTDMISRSRSRTGSRRDSRSRSRDSRSRSRSHQRRSHSRSRSRSRDLGVTGPTPSHKLLYLHEKPSMELSKNEISKYLDDCPYDLIIDSITKYAMESDNVFSFIDEFSYRDPTKTRIFIRGLNYESTKQSLREAFESFGAIEDSTVIFDRMTGKSKGYGFITFANANQAAAAVKEQWLEVDGRRAQISIATPLRHSHSATDGRSDDMYSDNHDDISVTDDGRTSDRGRTPPPPPEVERHSMNRGGGRGRARGRSRRGRGGYQGHRGSAHRSSDRRSAPYGNAPPPRGYGRSSAGGAMRARPDMNYGYNMYPDSSSGGGYGGMAAPHSYSQHSQMHTAATHSGTHSGGSARSMQQMPSYSHNGGASTSAPADASMYARAQPRSATAASGYDQSQAYPAMAYDPSRQSAAAASHTAAAITGGAAAGAYGASKVAYNPQSMSYVPASTAQSYYDPYKSQQSQYNPHGYGTQPSATGVSSTTAAAYGQPSSAVNTASNQYAASQYANYSNPALYNQAYSQLYSRQAQQSGTQGYGGYSTDPYYGVSQSRQ